MASWHGSIVGRDRLEKKGDIYIYIYSRRLGCVGTCHIWPWFLIDINIIHRLSAHA